MPNEQRSGYRSVNTSHDRRKFLKQSAALALAASGLPLISSGALSRPGKNSPETLVRILFDSLAGKQRKEVCFDWNHMDAEFVSGFDRGLKV